MTPEEETSFNRLLEELNDLASLTQQQAMKLYIQKRQNELLLVKVATLETIAKAMK